MKKLTMLLSLLCLTAALAVPASALEYGKAVRSDITRITRRLGDEIGKVYGWDFPKPRQAVSVER